MQTIVCAKYEHLVSKIRNILKGGSPLSASCWNILSRLARRKLVCREACSEESESAKVCTESHEAHKRLFTLGKRSQLRKASKQQV
jgi:hypothetical protein